MTSILTPQEICELDTFTLQEKIEQLQNLPNAAFYGDLLKIAKLQLIDRLETEEFGRKLANDQYKIPQQLHFPPTKDTPLRESFSSKPTKLFHNGKQVPIKLQPNLLSAGSFVTIGKPAVNHHFKPKAKKVQSIDPTKNFLKAKRTNFSVGKLKKIMNEKDKIVKKEQVATKKQQKQQVQKKEVNVQKIASIQINKPLPPPQQFSLKQKLKREVQEMKVIFRENDAYDDMRQIQLTPQNLLEEQIKMNESEPINTQIENNQLEKQQKVVQQSYELVQTQKQTQNYYQNKYQIQIQAPSEKKQPQNSNFVSIQLTCQDQTKEIEKTIPNYQIQEQIKQPPPPTISSISSINLDKLNLNQGSIKPNKQIKASSVRTLIKQPYQNLLSDNTTKASRFQDQIKQGHHKTNSIKFIKEENKVKPQHKMSKSNYGNFRNIITKPELYPYHQIIPSFHKLFPHSKNFLLTLRNVEQNLKLHFAKQVDEKSKSNEYLRLNDNTLTFNVISECSRAKKYAECFDIELNSFFERGRVMLDRIRGEFEVQNSNIMLYRVVRTKEEVYDIINSSFHRTKTWHELPHGMELRVSWNLLWTWSKPQIDFSDLFYFQKVNHFIGNKQIARKDLLKKNIENVQRLGGKIKQYFDIIPETFLLPGQNIAFIKKFRQYGLKDPLNYWILKPVGLSRGRGIQLVNHLQDVIFSQPVVLQRYVSNPFLIDGYKFDMRIYVLVTSMNPLEAFIYHEGFARLSTESYSLDQVNMDNKYIHLTNFSINRENIADKKLTLQQQLGGCKISMKMLKKRVQESGVAWQRIEKQIQDIVLKSLIACMNVIPQNPNCFQLFGYDIFLDSNLKCWLLEVNSSPSLQKQFMLDEVIKQQLVDDIMEIVCPINYNRARLLQIVERRRKEAEGLKSSINVSTNSVWQLDQDLNYILNGQKLRRYGETKHHNFKTIAPSDKYYSIVKVLQQYKIDPIIKQEK